MGRDQDLRALERRWRESGSREAEQAYLLALGRTRPLLRLDGLYVDVAAQQWLRFFAEGLAASVRTTELNAAQIGPWLTPDHPHCGGGSFRLEGVALEVSLGPEQGTVLGSTLAGRVRPGDRLALQPERAGSSPREFRFCPLPPERLADLWGGVG